VVQLSSVLQNKLECLSGEFHICDVSASTFRFSTLVGFGLARIYSTNQDSLSLFAAALVTKETNFKTFKFSLIFSDDARSLPECGAFRVSS
jgi:hypothetical protein